MARKITEEQVSAVNDEIAQAETTAQAFRIIDKVSRTMLPLLMDLNHIDPDRVGLGMAAREELARAHCWDPYFRNDDEPADGRGPCDLGGFEAHSRRPYECRRCRRRPIDHRQVPAAVR